MLKLIDYICALGVRALNIIFNILPTGFTLWLARRASFIIYLVNTERRAIGYANLRAAFSREKSPAELKVIIRKVYMRLVETFFEVMSLTKVNKRYVAKYIDIVDRRNIDDNAGYPNGIIFLTAHFGNWEFSGMVSAIEGYPLVVLAREQKMKKLNALIDRLREAKGMRVVRKGVTTRYIARALGEGKIIGMVADQDAGKTGICVDFFGRPASTAPGFVKFAAKTEALILPSFMARIKGPYHRLIVGEPIKVKKDDDPKPHLERYCKILEKHVRANPDQYLWLHRRWKSTPVKKVIILSDGKAGHINQSRAVADLLRQYREHAGSEPSNTEIDIVPVKFKNAFLKTLLSVTAIFSSGACQGCMRCLKFCLTRESYADLMKRYADVVISCGSGLAAVNRLFSLENNAKSACVMRPSLLGRGKFDMVILPRHDGKGTPDGSVVATDTVPNMINDEYLKIASMEVSRGMKSSRPSRIGVLLGGDNPDFALTADIAKKVADNILRASKRLDADILFTTSRRTTLEAEGAARKTLEGEERCKLFVSANEKNLPHAVGGILGLSDIIVVSGESASMVSEAVYARKPVVVFRLKKKRKKITKFERMLDSLRDRGYVIITEPDELSEAICGGMQGAAARDIPDDRYNVYKYMWRLS